MKTYRKEYNKLGDKEKIRRLEWVAQCYAAYLNIEDWKNSPFIDTTKYWDDFQKTLEESIEKV